MKIQFRSLEQSPGPLTEKGGFQSGTSMKKQDSGTKNNFKINFARMTVVLHKHKIAHWKCVLFTYICCRKALGQLQYHFMSSSFSQKIRHSIDIATVRMSFCNKYM